LALTLALSLADRRPMVAERIFDLNVGPLQFNWPAQKFADFYAAVADEAPVDRVVIGELVCSKRAPFYEDRLPEAIERLERGGKQVILASLALVTLERERRAARETFAQTAHEVEINDLTLMNWAREGKPFSVGPLVNVYNEATLAFLARSGARRVCLPPELPFASVETIAKAAKDIDVAIDVWAYGRIPLAISGRCYHARAHGLSKDSCQFVCEKDPDGLATRTLDGVDFLAINGVQTLSFKYANLIGDLGRLAGAGVAGLRLSPHDGDFIAVAKAFADVSEGRISAKEGLSRLRNAARGAEFTDGFLFGDFGAAPLPAF
jgi:collagenase-like PrtC family protease